VATVSGFLASHRTVSSEREKLQETPSRELSLPAYSHCAYNYLGITILQAQKVHMILYMSLKQVLYSGYFVLALFQNANT